MSTETNNRKRQAAQELHMLRACRDPHELIPGHHGGRAGKIGAPVTLPLAQGSGHVGVSLSSGRARHFGVLAAAQWLGSGGQVVTRAVGDAEDYWMLADGLTTRSDLWVPTGFGDAMTALAAELSYRLDLARRYASSAPQLGLPDPLMRPELYFRPLLLIDDDVAAVRQRLQTTYRTVGGIGVSPAESELAGLLQRGQAANMHVLSLAHHPGELALPEGSEHLMAAPSPWAGGDLTRDGELVRLPRLSRQQLRVLACDRSQIGETLARARAGRLESLTAGPHAHGATRYAGRAA